MINFPQWVVSLMYIELGCIILMFSTFMMNTHSCEWEWWEVITFILSFIVGVIVIPSIVICKLLELF